MQHQHVAAADRSDRVRAHTASAVNDRIDERTRELLGRAEIDPGFADSRLAELDREWDIDRAVMLWFGAMGTVAFMLAARSKKWWRFPLAAQVGFLMGQTVIGLVPAGRDPPPARLPHPSGDRRGALRAPLDGQRGPLRGDRHVDAGALAAEREPPARRAS